MYVFNLLETYVAGLSLLSTVFFEAIAVSWLYGKAKTFPRAVTSAFRFIEENLQ